MGQTLTHGVYLPDEGERNCYSGLAANWQILDGSVGTIAAHTAALAGKAPLVHTHTKSDVTDLFNSANEWTQINTYTVALRFSAANYSAGTPSSDIFYGSLQWGGIVNNTFVQSFGINNAIRTTGINDISLRVWSQTGSTLRGVAVETNADASNSSFRPLVNNVTNLGSTVYQWNNLYAKNYYYNGTAWGLDKNNTWTGTNTFAAVIQQKINSVYSQTPATDRFAVHEFLGTDSNRIFALNCADRSSGQREISLLLYDTDGSFKASGLFKESNNSVSFRPRSDNEISLGTPSFRWKTLNGINPGALSLPVTATTDASGDIVPPSGESSINLSGSANTYTPSNNGWLTLAINCASGNCIIVRQNTSNRDTLNYMQGYVPGQTNIYLTLPVLAGVTYYVFLYATSFVMARFALCQGNV